MNGVVAAPPQKTFVNNRGNKFNVSLALQVCDSRQLHLKTVETNVLVSLW
jgi:hypothetical protein